MVKTGRISKYTVFIAAVVLFLFLSGTYPAAAAVGEVYDEAGLLSEEEITALGDMLSSFAAESGWNIYAVTTEDAQQKQSQVYADDFFDAHSPDQEDGVVLLIDMDNREIALSTCGIAIRYLTDATIAHILDDAYESVSRQDYAGCFDSMLSGVQNAYQAGISDNQYNYDEKTGEISKYRHISGIEALISLVLAACVGIAVFFGIIGKYRLKFGSYQYNAHEFGSVHLTAHEDRFINQTETYRRIQTSSGSSASSTNRSTTHHSSSGRSHGGGSRKF